MRSITELFNLYGTDKITKGYQKVYGKIFEPFRNDVFTMLEIGIYEGASLKVWLDYFPNATIIGADIKSCDVVNDRYKYIEVNQGDLSSFDALNKYAPYKIIMDDASHKSLHIIQSLGRLYSMLSKNGMYIIEDLDCRRARIARELLIKDISNMGNMWQKYNYCKDALFIGYK